MSDDTTKSRGGRPRTGHLEFRGKTWWAQLTVDVDGINGVRRWVNLHTASKPAARVKVKRILAEQAAGKPLPTGALAEQAKRSETFAEARKRNHETRVADGLKTVKDELARLNAYASDLDPLDVEQIETGNVNAVLDVCKAKGKSRQTVQHVKQDIANVFAMLKREGAIKVNPAAEAELPKFPKKVKKVRAVLEDAELVRYLSWQHPEEHFMMATLERQALSCVARMFGGLRTGDLHALDWSSFDTKDGAFAWGWAPRQKTKTPQLLAIPEMLRPILRDWWERATSREWPNGKPASGPVFPVRRAERAGEARGKASHAKAFRRDLRRAFGVEALVSVEVTRSNNRKLTKRVWKTVRELTKRERELFEETAYTLPVDFHSWRRAYSQALADADVTAQQAQALAGHASLAAHQRYLVNASKMRTIPEAALPRIGVFHQVSGETGSNERAPMNENSELDGGRDRFRTCDIRLVSAEPDTSSSIKHAGLLVSATVAKPTETSGNQSLGGELSGFTQRPLNPAAYGSASAYLAALVNAPGGAS